MKTGYIYGLFDPREGVLRCYIGKTYYPDKRRRQHIAREKALNGSTRRSKWVIEILESGLELEFRILKEVSSSEWQQAEKDVMREHRDAGYELMNVVDGGGGMPDWEGIIRDAWEKNPARKKLVSERAKAMWAEPGFRERYKQTMEAYWADPANKEKASKIQARIWVDNEEGKQKIKKVRLANWEDPEYRRRVTESNVEAWSDPELLRQHSEQTKAMWEDPDYRGCVTEAIIASNPRRSESLRKYWNEHPGDRERRGKEIRERWQDPDFRERHAQSMEGARPKISQAVRKYYSDPEARRRSSEAAKERMRDPELRQQISDSVKVLWQDPEYRAKQDAVSEQKSERMHESATEYWSHDEHREQASEAARDRWADPEYRAKQAEAAKKRFAREKAARVPSDIEKAMEALGMAKRTVHGYCQQGLLGRKVDGRWVITDGDIEGFEG